MDTDKNRTSTTSDDAVRAAGEHAQKVEEARQEQIKKVSDKVEEVRLTTIEWQQRHEIADTEHREKMMEEVGKLATKKDMAEILDFMGKVDITFAIIRGTGRYGKSIIFTLAALIVAITVITGGFKAAIASVATWALAK